MGVRTWRLRREFGGGGGEDDSGTGSGSGITRVGFSDSSFGGAPSYHPDSSEFSASLQTSSGASQSSYDASTSTSSCTNFDTTDVALSSYLMDGSVRAILKKVTVNESVLIQTIESFGGGEKGLKELMAYIITWVREHKDKNAETLSLSQDLENLRKAPPPPAAAAACAVAGGSAGYGLSPLEPPYVFEELHQGSEPCTKSRRLDGGTVDRSDAYRGTLVSVNGTLPQEFQFPEMKMGSGSSNGYIGTMMVQQPGMYHPEQQMMNPAPLGFYSFTPGHDDLNRRTLAATTTRAARRNRIARQRQHSLPRTGSTSGGGASWSPPFSPSPSTLDLRGAGAAGAGMFAQGAPQASVVPARKANNADMLTFLLQKELRPSDVGNLGRIILPKKEAEMCLPILALREGLVLQMEDFDSGICWNIRYRFWPNNKSRMYLLESTGEFVKRHHLQEGDLLILYRNPQGNYVLRGKKKVLSESRRGAQGIQQKSAHSLARGFPEASRIEEVQKERDLGLGDGSYPKVMKERDLGLEFDDRKALKADRTVLVGDDDPFFKEEVMHNIGCSFGPGLLPPLERFPSLNLDFPLDEIMAGMPKDYTEIEQNLSSSIAVPKAEPE